MVREHSAVAAQLDLHAGLEVRHVVPVLLGKLLRPPRADLRQALCELVLGRREAAEEVRVPVAHHDRATERLHALERLRRLRPDRDVAEAEEAVDIVVLELGEDGVQREAVAVDVRDQRDPHRTSLPGPEQEGRSPHEPFDPTSSAESAPRASRLAWTRCCASSSPSFSATFSARPQSSAACAFALIAAALPPARSR